MLLVKQNAEGKYGLTAPGGKIVVPFEYDSISSVKGSYGKDQYFFAFEKNGKKGLGLAGPFDSYGVQMVAPCEYESVGAKFCKITTKAHAYVIELNGKFGIWSDNTFALPVTSENGFILPCEYDSIRFDIDGYGYIDGNGLIVEKDGKFGATDLSCRIAVNCKCDTAEDAKKALAKHIKNEVPGEILLEKYMIIQKENSDWNRFGVVDITTGKLVVEIQYTTIREAKEELMRSRKEEFEDAKKTANTSDDGMTF